MGKPMMSFLSNKLADISRQMLLMFLIRDMLEKIKFPADLVNIDIYEEGSKLPFSMLKLPTETSSVLRRLEV